MAFEINGKTIETTENGYLVDHTEWNEEVAAEIAKIDGLELQEQHWDVMNYLRDEYINNNGNQPNDRNMIKAMSEKLKTSPAGQSSTPRCRVHGLAHTAPHKDTNIGGQASTPILRRLRRPRLLCWRTAASLNPSVWAISAVLRPPR